MDYLIKCNNEPRIARFGIKEGQGRALGLCLGAAALLRPPRPGRRRPPASLGLRARKPSPGGFCARSLPSAAALHPPAPEPRRRPSAPADAAGARTRPAGTRLLARRRTGQARVGLHTRGASPFASGPSGSAVAPDASPLGAAGPEDPVQARGRGPAASRPPHPPQTPFISRPPPLLISTHVVFNKARAASLGLPQNGPKSTAQLATLPCVSPAEAKRGGAAWRGESKLRR